MQKKMVVLSFDAMVGEDIAYLRNKPDSQFNRVMGNCAWVGKMQSVYPSITYPAHFSMASGCFPGKSGLYQNHHLPVGDSGKKGWILESNHMPVEDFFAAAKRAGMMTAAVYWPSMANNPNIDYLINEYFFPDPEEDVMEGFAKQGANRETLEAVRDAMAYFPTGYRNRIAPSRENTFDDFIIESLCNLIKKQKPDFAVAHHCYIDTVRHRYGLFNEHVQAAVDVVDDCIGRVADALQEAGIYEDTDLVIISDHGQMNICRNVKANILMQRGGFQTLDEEGALASWQAYVQSCGMSAYVFLKNKEDEKLYQAVYEYLNKLKEDGVWGVSEVLTQQQVRQRYELYGDFSFVLESDGYTSFNDALTGPLVGHVDYTDYRLGSATHGYSPEKGPQPIFCAKGPHYTPGAYMEQGSITDIAPTLAAAMGQKMPDAQGTVLSAILNV